MGGFVFLKFSHNSTWMRCLLPIIAGAAFTAALIAGIVLNQDLALAYEDQVTDVEIEKDQSDLIPSLPGDELSRASTALTTMGQNVGFLRQLGGEVSAVAIRENIAFVGIGTEMAALELNNPGNPDWVGGVLFNNNVESIAISDTLAYVAAGEAGLRVVDISNLDSLREIGSTEGGVDAIDVVLSGNYAYIADYTNVRLTVVDITDPFSPSIAGFYELDTLQPNKVVVRGNYAYLATSLPYDMGGGMVILDVSNPDHPQWVEFYDAVGRGVDLAVRAIGTEVYAFVAVTSAPFYGSLQVIDVTDPQSPTQTGRYDLGGATSALALDNDELYIPSFGFDTGYFNDLIVLDISNPKNPTKKSSYELPMALGQYQPALDMVAASGYLYLCLTDGIFQIEDISNPNEPRTAGVYDTFLLAHGIVISGDTAYVADVRGLKLVDVQNPMNAHVGNFVTTPGYAEGVAVKDSYAYVADRSEGMRIIDISGPGNPVEVGSFTDGLVNVRSVAVAGDYAYLTDWQGMAIVNISDPQHPYQESRFAMTSSAIDVSVDGSYVYIAQDSGSEIEGGMRVVNVSDPAHPTDAGFYPTSAERQAIQVVVRDDLAYLVSGAVEIIDVSYPTQPELIGAFLPPYGGAARLTLEGDYAFVAVRGDWIDRRVGSLRVLDISVPSNPVEVGSHEIPDYYPLGIAVRDGTVYVTSAAGIYVYQYTSNSIRGSVVDVHNDPVENVHISVSTGLSTTTSVDGSYTIPGLPSGTYTVTPSLAGFVFFPPARTVTVPPTAANQDFMILSPPIGTTLEPFAFSDLTYTDTQGLPTDLFFPTGTVTTTTDMIFNPLGRLPAPFGQSFAGHAFELTATREEETLFNLVFLKPVSVTIQYSLEDVSVISDTQSLGLWHWTAGEWRPAAQSCLAADETSNNLVERIISTPICMTGQYALFGPTYQAYLPIVGKGNGAN